MHINANENEMTQITQEINDTFETVDLSKYNGEITAFNPATNQHRTFRISTVKKGNLEGKRIVSLLSGSDNENDYIGFGFVKEDGSIALWKKHTGTQYEKLAKFLENADYHATYNSIQFKFAVRCRKCNRKLTDPVSIDSGIGPICAGR